MIFRQKKNKIDHNIQKHQYIVTRKEVKLAFFISIASLILTAGGYFSSYNSNNQGSQKISPKNNIIHNNAISSSDTLKNNHRNN